MHIVAKALREAKGRRSQYDAVLAAEDATRSSDVTGSETRSVLLLFEAFLPLTVVPVAFATSRADAEATAPAG